MEGLPVWVYLTNIIIDFAALTESFKPGNPFVVAYQGVYFSPAPAKFDIFCTVAHSFQIKAIFYVKISKFAALEVIVSVKAIF